ncbi:MAG: PilZ domain-containing protein [Candidatus Aminicenantes bacterium]|nr:PilZ domain-containing protein [Candidatus Aminicenantes bacterium]
MADAMPTQRACDRFRVPGAVAGYRILSSRNPRKGFDEETCPVFDLSRGGLCFWTQEPLGIDQKIYLEITVPGEASPLGLYGAARWIRPNPGLAYKHQVGVQFNPYGDKKGQNSPVALIRLTALEESYAARKASIPAPPKF